jgi:eukaryotic-like serine/threonine-protein kinase
MSAETLLNGRYRLIAQQGSGGMAVIYKAIDEMLKRTVAVKILRPSLTADPTFIARFQNEARSIANLSHPNIVTVHDVGSQGQTHYIVMEFVDGRDLKKVIREHGALPLERVLNYAIGIAAGLGFAHRAGLVHADVKPQNILINRDDQIKITDFGIAQALSDTQPAQREAVVWGSPHYFAPEQARGEKPTAAADVYSIGIVMFELLTGRLPYTGTDQQELARAHVQSPIPRVTDIKPSIPEALSQIVYKLMSKEPTDRYQMADQLGQILISYRDRERQARPISTEPPPRQSIPPPAQPAQRTPPPPTAIPGQSQVAPPTQRYNAAPNAPRFPQSDSRPFASIPASNLDSRPLTNRFPYNQNLTSPRERTPPPLLDGVTIALAVLAFMSVACLIPLYIAVFLART